MCVGGEWGGVYKDKLQLRTTTQFIPVFAHHTTPHQEDFEVFFSLPQQKMFGVQKYSGACPPSMHPHSVLAFLFPFRPRRCVGAHGV